MVAVIQMPRRARRNVRSVQKAITRSGAEVWGAGCPTRPADTVERHSTQALDRHQNTVNAGREVLRLPFSMLAPMSLTFADASARVDAYISQFREGYFPPLLMLARLTEETGEIARVIAHMSGKTPKPGEDMGDLELELADLLFVMVCMANERGLSLERGFDRMMHKVETRDARRWTRKDEGGEATPGPDAGEVELDAAQETP